MMSLYANCKMSASCSFFKNRTIQGKSGDIYSGYDVDDADDDVGGDDLDDDLEEQEVESEPLRAQLDHARSQK